jgi:hypothetical protein
VVGLLVLLLLVAEVEPGVVDLQLLKLLLQRRVQVIKA